MPQPVCPKCGASLDDDLVASTGSAECPFCGAELDPAQFATPLSTNLDMPVGVEVAGALVRPEGLPAGSPIQVVESGRDRQVIFVPPGGKTAGLGCFALFWNGFMLCFTPPWFFAGKDGPPWYVIGPFLALFWAVGLGMLYAWLRMRFSRHYILLERDRIVVQRVLFGHKSLTESLLGPESRAELVESYQQNDVPVYAVCVNGMNRKAKFGTALTNAEKDWFVDTINRFLGVGVAGAAGEQAGTAGAVDTIEEDIPDVDPVTILSDGPITIEEAKPDELRLSYRAIPSGGAASFFGLGMMAFSLVWLGITSGTAAAPLLGKNPGPFEFLFAAIGTVIALVGLAPLLMGLFVFRGRTTVELTRDRLRCRWHVGALGYSKSVPAASITNVSVSTGMQVKNRRVSRPRQQQVAGPEVKVCMVSAAGKFIPLTLFHEVAVARSVAGLVRHQLHSMGFRLQDA